MRRGAYLQMAISNVVMALLLFGGAGTLAWPEAWVLLALFDLYSLGLGLWLKRRDPALLAERATSPLARDQRPRDRAIMMAMIVFFAVWLVAMALDARRFAWSHVPIWLQIVGAVLIGASYLGWVDVFRVNSFASTRIKMQADRHQTVISTGPYAIVRHPMYSWTLPFLAGISLLLGSLWGLLGVIAIMPLLTARILGEEDLLLDGLPGYRAYARTVRYRLVPFIW